MVEKIKACGGDARLTLLKKTGHDSWNAAYNSKEVFDWLLTCKRRIAPIGPDGYDNAEQFG